jgi:hypothetical protein
MARPADNLFNAAESKTEKTLINIISKARKDGIGHIVDRALEELNTLYRLVEIRNGN